MLRFFLLLTIVNIVLFCFFGLFFDETSISQTSVLGILFGLGILAFGGPLSLFFDLFLRSYIVQHGFYISNIFFVGERISVIFLVIGIISLLFCLAGIGWVTIATVNIIFGFAVVFRFCNACVGYYASVKK